MITIMSLIFRLIEQVKFNQIWSDHSWIYVADQNIQCPNSRHKIKIWLYVCCKLNVPFSVISFAPTKQIQLYKKNSFWQNYES